MLAERSFDTGEVVLNYAEGPPSGPVLVLLHGLTGRWQGWQHMIPRLTPHWHVYAPDLRGHGGSGRVAGRYHLVDYARDTVAFLRSLPEPAVVMGHSLGALTALAAAAFPAGIRAAVLLDPPLYIRDTSIEATPGFKEYFCWVYDTVTTTSSEGDVAADAPLIALRDRLLAGFDLAGALRDVRCPLLLLYGDWDHGAAMRDSDAEFVHANLSTAVIVKVPDGSHAFPGQQPEMVLQQAEAFLRSALPDQSP